MPAYDYLALTATGARQRGVTEADTEQQARQRLRDQGLVPLSVEASRRGSGVTNRRPAFGRGARLSGDQVVLFTRLLGTLLSGPATGLFLAGTLSAIISAVVTAVFLVLVAQVYRQLSGRATGV